MPEKNFIQPPIDFRAAFEATSCNSALVLADAPEYTILAATAGFLKNSNAVKEQLIGNGFFDCFPSNPDDKTDTGAAMLRDSFAWVIQHKKTQELPAQRYDVADETGVFTERYWKSVNEPVLNAAGEVAYIIHNAEEVTQHIKIKEQESYIKDMEQLHNIFMQAPVAIHIFKGRDLVIEMANDLTLKLWGKTADVIGEKLVDVFSDFPIDAYIEELHHVMDSGKVQRVFERPATMEINGKQETVYLNYVFQPYYEKDETKASGILVWVNNVTEKVLSEKALHESEMHFQQIANTLPLVVWTASPDGNLTFISEQWENLYGNPVSESLGAGWVSFLHPDDVAHSAGKWALALNSGIDYDTEFRVRYKDGSYRWVLVRAVPIKDGAGNIMSWYGSNTDIHSQRETEQQIRSLVESAPFPIGVYTGKEMRIMLANRAIMDVWGKGNDVVGKLYSELMPELADQHIFQQLDEVYSSGIPLDIKNQKIELFKNGKSAFYYFNYSFTPLFDSNGKVYGVMNTAAEITDLTLAKQRVEANERSIRNTILKAPVAMCILNGPDHVVEIANERMMEVWGAVGRFVTGRPIFEVLPEAKDQGFETILQEVYSTGKTYAAQDVPVSLPRGEGVEDVFVTFVFEAYSESEESISGIIAVALDVTAQVVARKQIEEVIAERTGELAEANANLQRSNAELAQFAYIASHDLQEPLRKISVFAQMLGKHLTNVIDAQTQNYLGKIDNSVARMINLVRDVLVYSELTKQNDIFKSVDLKEISEGAKTDFELLIEQREASIEFHGMPVIEAIPLQMSQLFSNLLSNALKFSRDGVKPVITVNARVMKKDELAAYPSANRDALYYHIEFRDNGIGFSPEYAEQIFNIFQRLHGKTAYSGTGIGLAMCRKIVQNHHGFISAEGNEDGAVFNVVLPARQ